jgi:septal ring factor EnvC (AmiA/AmiB activator)
MPGEVALDGVAEARDLWLDVETEAAAFLRVEAARLTEQLQAAVAAEYETERGREDERYRSRQGEVSRLIQEQTLARLEREIVELRKAQLVGTLFDNEERLAELERSMKEKQEEIDRRRRHLEELQQQLRRERTRVLEHILPKRYALRGEAQVFPIAAELWLPEGAA